MLLVIHFEWRGMRAGGKIGGLLDTPARPIANKISYKTTIPPQPALINIPRRHTLALYCDVLTARQAAAVDVGQGGRKGGGPLSIVDKVC